MLVPSKVSLSESGPRVAITMMQASPAAEATASASALFEVRTCTFQASRGGTVTWVAIPFYVIFELFGPIIEVAGYLFIIICALMGWIAWPQAVIFLGLAIGLGVLLSTSAIMLEEQSFHMYPRFKQLALLYLVAILENFGFRQLTAIWRFQGLMRWLRGGKHTWETLTRSTNLADDA